MPIPQITTVVIIFLFWWIITRRIKTPDEPMQPNQESKKEDDWFWEYKKGGDTLYKMIQLTHKDLKVGIRAEIDNGQVTMIETPSGMELKGFDHQAPRFNYTFLKRSMERHLQEKLPRKEIPVKPIKTIEEHKLKPYKPLTTDDKLEIIGGRTKRFVYNSII